jgi:1-acyl-sn-glycerol-3-phosphate acyltransferase
MGITTVIFFIPGVIIWIVTLPFDRRRKLLHLYTCLWGSMYTWIVPAWRIRINGRDNLKKAGTCIIVSNHQSQLDILLACRIFRHFKWVSKAEIFSVPFIGWMMRFNRYVALTRGDRDSAEKMMAHCEERLREGSPVFFFPEGTRSATGKVRLFKPGPFMLAHKLKLPLVPVVISGTGEALPKYSLTLDGTKHISLKILPEIPYSSFSSLTITETAMMVRNVIIDNMTKPEADA